MQQVIFRLLGPPEIRYKEQLIRIPRRRSRALLYYMACTHTPQPRERLLALLCGEIDEESARHTFKTLLAEVRALLRGFDSTIEWIVSEGDQLTLNPLAPVWLDTEIFEKATATTSRNLNRAINLYRGDFLDGFFLKDSSGFEAWVRSTRDHFHHLYLSALRHLAELYESEGQLEQAITCTQMLLNADPLSEEAHARLMRLYWTAGDRVEALRQYERLCIVLAKELAVKPLASTQALHAQIAHSSKWPPAAKSSSPVSRLQPKQVQTGPSSHRPVPAIGEPAALPVLPFVGRTKELAWLQGQLTGPANHHPLLLIQGEAGIGKTRLIQETLRRFCSSWIILQGTCQEIEREQPYHAIIEALRQGLAAKDLTQLNLPRPWLTQIAQLIPDLLQSDATAPELSPIEPIILADALVALFNQLAHPQRPLLLVLDDLHWADTTTLALLGHLVRHTRQGSVFLLGAFCNAIAEERLAPLRQSAYRQHALAELALSSLQPEDISELATLFLSRHYTSTGQAKDSEFLVNWCCQRSEGNPFFAVEWLSLAVRERGAGQNLPATLIPEPVETLIKNQLGLLSHEATSLLTAAAFLGVSFNLLTAAALMDFDKRTTIAASDELIKREFVVEAPAAGSGYYTFTHRAVRDVLLSRMSTMQRHLLHQLSKAL